MLPYAVVNKTSSWLPAVLRQYCSTGLRARIRKTNEKILKKQTRLL